MKDFVKVSLLRMLLICLLLPNFTKGTSSKNILTAQDWEIEKARNPRLKWKCYPAKAVSFECSYSGTYEVEGKKEPHAISRLFVQEGNVVHEYLERRGYPKQFCLCELPVWKYLLKNEKKVCISGDPLGYQKKDREIEQKFPDKTLSSWILSRIKTEKGCWSYFVDENQPCREALDRFQKCAQKHGLEY